MRQSVNGNTVLNNLSGVFTQAARQTARRLNLIVISNRKQSSLPFRMCTPTNRRKPLTWTIKKKVQSGKEQFVPKRRGIFTVRISLIQKEIKY